MENGRPWLRGWMPSSSASMVLLQRERNARFDTEQAEAYCRNMAEAALEAAVVAATLAAHTPMLEEHWQSIEIQWQQDGMVHDQGDVAIKGIGTDRYRYTHLGFLETCTQQDRWTLVDGKVSTLTKRE